MTSHSLRYLANCSMLFTEVPLLERPAAAKAAGFDTVEFWWPWPDQPVPGDAESTRSSPPCRTPACSSPGSTSSPATSPVPTAACSRSRAASQQFRDNVEVTLGIGERLGTKAFNALYGNRVDDATPGQQDDLGAENLAYAAKAADRLGATVLVEPVSGPKPYPLRTADDAVGVVDRVRATGTANVGFLCDLFHLANNGDDVDAAIANHADRIAHVQIADAPGRGEPGSGDLPLDRWLGRARAVRLRRLRRPRVQAHDHDRGEPRLAPGRASLNL